MKEKKLREGNKSLVTAIKIVGVLVVAGVIFLGGFCSGHYQMQYTAEKQIEAANRNANEKVEIMKNKLLPDRDLAKAELYAEFVADLKAYKESLVKNNPGCTTHEIDSMIDSYTRKARDDVDECEALVPGIDLEKIREEKDTYVEGYVQQLESLADQYPKIYPINRMIRIHLENLEDDYYTEIESAKLLQNIQKLEEKCKTNQS